MSTYGSSVKRNDVILLYGLFGFFLLLLFYPLSYVLYQAFVVDGHFSLLYFSLLLQSSVQWELTLNGINIALAVTLLTTCIAVPLSLLFVRHSFAGKQVFQGLLLLPMLLPPFVGAFGMQKLLGRFGTLNLLLLDTGILRSPIDFLGAAPAFGVIALQALHLYPLLFVMLSSALASVDVTLEEAAQTAGASRSMVLRRIVLPLAFPGYFAGAVLVFVGSFTDLGTPLMFQYRKTVPVQIFQLLGEVSSNPYGYALVVFVTVCCLFLFLLSRLIDSGGTFHSGGRVSKHRPVTRLSRRATIICWIGMLALIAVALMPHIGVFLLAFAQRWVMTPLPEAYTLSHFVEVFHHPLSAVGMRNSVLLSTASTFLTVILGITCSFLLERSKVRGRGILQACCLIPLAVPGIVIAFGYASAFSGTILDTRVNPFPLLILAYTVRKLPFMVRAASAGFAQASTVLEEAAYTVGASRARALRRITVPLIMRHVLGGALLCFSFAVLEVSDSLLLALEDRFYPISKSLYALSLRPDGIPLASALAVLTLIVTGVCLFAAKRLMGKKSNEALFL